MFTIEDIDNALTQVDFKQKNPRSATDNCVYRKETRDGVLRCLAGKIIEILLGEAAADKLLEGRVISDTSHGIKWQFEPDAAIYLQYLQSEADRRDHTWGEAVTRARRLMGLKAA